MYTPSFSEQDATPTIIKNLIILTAVVSLSSALLDPFFIYVLGIQGPQEFLSLSWTGLQSFFLWQPITYMFLYPSAGGISIFSLIFLCINLFLLWLIGSNLIREVGNKVFLQFYLTTGLIAGAAGCAVMAATGTHGYIVGCTANIYAMVLVWAMLHPDLEVLFFFLFRTKIKFLAAGIIGVDLLINLSNSNFIPFCVNLTGVLAGYGFALWTWNLQGPFAFTHRFDLFVNEMSNNIRVRKEEAKKRDQTIYQKAKVFDFKTGNAIVSDDEFTDLMLTKISKYGEESLSWKERRRLKRVSEGKRHNLN